MTLADPLACAINDFASTQNTSFAITQAVWRFLNNQRVTFSQLNNPLLSWPRLEIAHSPHAYASVVLDWSRLAFCSHHSKTHHLKMTHSTEVRWISSEMCRYLCRLRRGAVNYIRHTIEVLVKMGLSDIVWKGINDYNNYVSTTGFSGRAAAQ